MGSTTEDRGPSRLQRRMIEAAAVAPVIREVSERIGWEEAVAALAAVNRQEAYRRGRHLAERVGRNGIDELAEDVASWGRGGELEMVILERTPRTFFFNVTRCPYFEAYRELGLEALGVAFSCCRDEPFARGFNPRLRLVRTRTIMEGADHCDFRYHLDGEIEAPRAGREAAGGDAIEPLETGTRGGP